MTPSRQYPHAPDRNQVEEEWYAGIRQRVREAIEESDLDPAEIARRLPGKFRTNRPQVSRWVGEKTTPDTEALLQLCAILGVNGHWLLTGKGDRRVQPGEADEVVELIRRLVNPSPGASDEERREMMARVREMLPPFGARGGASSGGGES